MRKLIILVLFCSLSQNTLLGQDLLGNKVYILDDCAKWESTYRSDPPPGLFTIFNDQLNDDRNGSVLLSSISYNDEPYQVFLHKLIDIKGEDKLFSSELSYMDWIRIDEENDRIFIIHPNDFCSGKRFAYGNIFKVYEVIISVSDPTTECVIETIVDPMDFFRIDSTKVRTRKKD